MPLFIGGPYVQYCPKCGWKNPLIVDSDVLIISDCPECQTSLSLKPLSELSFIEKIQLKIAEFRIKKEIEKMNK